MAPPATTRERPLVVVVDDEPLVLRVLSRVLIEDGYEVATAATGGQARELVRNEHPDVVVSDVALDGESGLDLCAELHAIDPALPILLLSGHTQGGADKPHGVFRMLSKPIPAVELWNAVREALASRNRD